MNIDELKRFVEAKARKSQAGSNPTPAQFNLYVDRAFKGWVMERYGNPKEYQPGMPIPRIGYQQTQKISDDLSFLIENREFQLDANGRLNTPDGDTVTDINSQVAPEYLHLSSVRYRYIRNNNGVYDQQEVPVDVLRDNEVGHVLSSSVVRPTRRFPKMYFKNDQMCFEPKSLGIVEVTYLRTPATPVWGFGLDANERPVYDPSVSVDVESPDITHEEIANRILSFLGISTRENVLAQDAEIKKQQGL